MISFKRFSISLSSELIWGVFIAEKKKDWQPSFENSLNALFPSLPLQYAYTQQIHSDTIQYIEHPGISDSTDGLFSYIPHLVLSVYTADCLPFMAYFPKTGNFGIVHAGWKGIYKHIVPKLLQKLSGEFSKSLFYLDIFPHICEKCYQVGEDFRDFFPEDSLLKEKKKLSLGLKREIFRQLHEAHWDFQFFPESPTPPIFSELCNYENSEYPSYRGGRTGQIVSFCFLLSLVP